MARQEQLKKSTRRLPPPPLVSDSGLNRWLQSLHLVLTTFDDPRTMAARVYNSVNQTPGAGNAISFDTVRANNGGLWTSANPTRLTALQSGLYAISFTGTFNANDQTWFRVTGTDQITSNSVSATTAVIATVYPLLQNDYVEVIIVGGSQVNNSAKNSPEFAIHWLAPNQETD